MKKPNGVGAGNRNDDDGRVGGELAAGETDTEADLLEAQYQEARAALPPEYQKWLDETAGMIHVDSPFDAAELPYPE